MSILDKFFNRPTELAEETYTGKEVTMTPTQKTNLLSQIEKDYAYRTKQTIKTWRFAVNAAESDTNPNRNQLYKVYKEIMLDTAVIGAIETRIERVLGTPFKIVNDSNETDKESTNKIQSPWFYKVGKEYMKAKFWGHTLLQITDIVDGNNIGNVNLIPRENVIPEVTGFMPKANQYSDYINYRQEKYYKWLIENMIDPKFLGLLMEISPLVLWKKQAIISWNEFTEVFGLPVRIGTTQSNKPEDRTRLFDMLKNMASSAVAILDPEDEIEFKETNNVDAYQTFLELINTMDKQINKAILGNDMMVDGASNNQAKLYMGMFNDKTMADLREMEFWVNGHLIPKLIKLGIFSGGKFKFDRNEKLDLRSKMVIDSKLVEFYELDPEYLEETYGTKIIKRIGTDDNTGAL